MTDTPNEYPVMPAELAIIDTPEAASTVLSPVRRRVLRALRDPGSATSVADEIGLPRQKVNYHVRALEESGLVEHVEDRRKGGCTERVVRATATHYLLDPGVLAELGPTPTAGVDRFSADHLAAVSARTVSEVGELKRRAAKARKRLPTLSLETAIRFRSAGEQAEFVEALTRAINGLAARYHDEGASGGRWFRVAVGAHPALAPGRGKKDGPEQKDGGGQDKGGKNHEG